MTWQCSNKKVHSLLGGKKANTSRRRTEARTWIQFRRRKGSPESSKSLGKGVKRKRKKNPEGWNKDLKGSHLYKDTYLNHQSFVRTELLNFLRYQMNHSVPWTPTTSPCPPLLLSCPSSLSAPQNKFISPQVKELPFSFPPASGSPGVSSERPLERVRGGEAEPCRSRGLEGSTESEEAAEGKAGAAAELKSVQPSLLQ